MFGSTRVLDGDVPYKDFWAIYPPGQFYILAGIIKLFGPNLLIARIFDTLIRFLMVDWRLPDHEKAGTPQTGAAWQL